MNGSAGASAKAKARQRWGLRPMSLVIVDRTTPFIVLPDDGQPHRCYGATREQPPGTIVSDNVPVLPMETVVAATTGGDADSAGGVSGRMEHG